MDVDPVTARDWLKLHRTPQIEINRKRIQEDVQSFLERGGVIQQIPKGVSSWDEDAIEFMAKKIRHRKRND
jgi:uncharacterized protein YoaH (UPF0181 family)